VDKWFQDNSKAVVRVIDDRSRLGMRKMVDFLVEKTKEILSVPAPKTLVKPRFGAPYYRALTPATPGAPPRKLSGALQASIYGVVRGNGTHSWGVVGTDLIYGAPLEKRNHPFVTLAMKRYGNHLRMILARSFRRM